MRRNYIYTPSVPFLIADGEHRLEINKGDIITKEYEEGNTVHCTTSFGRSFRILKEYLDKFFKQVFDYEEMKYYRQLRDKAAVAAMQGIIANGIEDRGGPENNIKYLVSASVQVATALVEELKATA